MNIPPLLLLIFGLMAATLFAVVFAVALIITVRNRRIIQRHYQKSRK